MAGSQPNLRDRGHSAPAPSGSGDVALLLDRVSKRDAGGIHAEALAHVDLADAGGVEARAPPCEA